MVQVVPGGFLYKGMGNSIYHTLFTPRARYFFLPSMSKRISPAKSWCFTLNNYSKKEHGSMVLKFTEISEKNPNFFYIVAKEIGDSGTPHLQGYVASDKKFRPLPMFSVKRDGVECIRFFKAKGNMRQNVRYCKKDGDYLSNIKMMMEIEEAQTIWDKPDVDPPCEWACPKDEWDAYQKHINEKEVAAQVLIRADFEQIYERLSQDS